MTEASRVHCIGDSQISLFSGIDAVPPLWPEPAARRRPPYVVHHVGPATAFGLDRDGTRSLGRRRVRSILRWGGIRRDERLLLSFGAADCMLRLPQRAASRGSTLPEEAAAAVENYLREVRRLQRAGWTLALWGPAPFPQHDLTQHGWPVWPDTAACNDAVVAFNDVLSVRAREEGVQAACFARTLLGTARFADAALFFDQVHLRASCVGSLESIYGPGMSQLFGVAPTRSLPRQALDWMQRAVGPWARRSLAKPSVPRTPWHEEADKRRQEALQDAIRDALRQDLGREG